jgi:hypothetical protein
MIRSTEQTSQSQGGLRAVGRSGEVWPIRSLTGSKSRPALMCGPASAGEQRQGRDSSWQAELRQGGAAVVPQDSDRSLSAGRAYVDSADGITADEPPFAFVSAVASKAHV